MEQIINGVDVKKLKNDIACKENIINHLADSNVSLQQQLRRKEEEYNTYKQALDEIEKMCKIPNEPYYNSECEYGIGRIDMAQDVLQIIQKIRGSNVYRR